MAFFLALGLSACRSPESDYKKLKQEVDRGEFNSTLVKTDAAMRQYGLRDAIWGWRFRLLKARILVSRSQGDDALSLLSPEPPADLAPTEIPEQRKLFQGIAHRYTQQFAEAERDFAETERLAAPLAPVYACQLLIARAALLVDEKEYEAAQVDYRRAISLARRYSLSVLEADALADLARLATSQGHFDEALDLYFPALQLAHSLEIKGTAATILGNLGWSYFELGDFEASLEFYKQGANASAKTGLPVYSAYWFSGVANAYLALRQYSPAEDLARTTLENARKLKNAQTITACLNILAEVMLRTHRITEAETFNQEALRMEEAGLDKLGVLDSLLLAGHVAAAQKRFSDADKFFQRILAEQSLEKPLQWEAEAGLAGVRDDEGKPVEAEQSFRRAIDIIETARRSINHDELRLSFLSSGITVYSEYIDFLIRHRRSTDALNQADLSRARTLAEGLSPQRILVPTANPRVPPQKLAQRLRATLLFYWLGEEQSYLWVITPTKAVYFDLPKAGDIAPLVKSYRKAILGMRDAQDAGAADGKKLYAMLVEPAKKMIPRGSRVILLPAESLYGLNFETLVVPDPQPHFWIEDVTLTTASSLTLLASSATRPASKEKGLLLVGNTEPNASFSALAQAPVEMEKIEHYFPDQNRKVLEGKSATPTAYLNSSPEKFAYLHFVTHGTASITRPLESAVILSSEGDSYKLYARDIVKHRLNAQLVTISACDGLGKRTYSGEGLVGLSWAFLRAGAHNVIGALWEVSDASTPQLMDSLYGGLSQGKDPATALRDAKLSLLHSSSDTVFKKPFYWAPFQLYAGS